MILREILTVNRSIISSLKIVIKIKNVLFFKYVCTAEKNSIRDYN